MIVWVRPENDATALVLSGWAEKFLHCSVEHGVLDLRRVNASRQAVSDALANAQALFFFGHGSADALFGAQGPLLDEQNVNLTSSRIVIAIACDAARGLGTAAVLEGAAGFLGFNDRLAWPMRFAEDFGRAALSSVEEIMRGATLGEAADAMRRNFGSLESAFKESTDPDAALVWSFAFWNQCHVELKGDGSATLERVGRAIAHGPGLPP
jgi:hypothetical protein